MTILYSKRILPSNQDTNENSYMRIPGTILNNELDIEGNYTAPSLHSPVPSTAPSSSNHEIRLMIENPTKPNAIDSTQQQSIYFLPSSCFSFHNIVSNKLTLVLPDTSTIELFQGDSNSEDGTNIYTSTITESGISYPITLETDGILSACYEFCFNNSYTDLLGYNHYGFVIGTYLNQSMTDEQMFPTLYGSTSLLNNLSSTREFEIGYDSHLFTNVSLLYHGKIKEYTGSSPTIGSDYFEGINNIYTDLYWVGVTLFYTNAQGKVCSSANGTTINIRSTVGSPFENSFKPFFGKRTKTVETIPSEYKAVERTQFGIQRGCPISTNTAYGYSDVFGNIYVGDGTLAVKNPNYSRDLLKVSQSVSLADVLDTDTHIFIVLLPC